MWNGKKEWEGNVPMREKKQIPVVSIKPHALAPRFSSLLDFDAMQGQMFFYVEQFECSQYPRLPNTLDSRGQIQRGWHGWEGRLEGLLHRTIRTEHKTPT